MFKNYLFNVYGGTKLLITYHNLLIISILEVRQQVINIDFTLYNMYKYNNIVNN